jgi:hypothetical protein
MKTLIISLMLLSFGAQAQLVKQENYERTVIGEVKQTGSFVAKLSSSVIKSDTLYTVTYRNCEYIYIDDIKVFYFPGKQTLDDLYNELTSFFADPEKKEQRYKLRDQDVRVHAKKVAGKQHVFIYLKDGYFALNQKQLNKLFNRKTTEEGAE